MATVGSAVVVVESGGRWPFAMREGHIGARDLVVIVQQPDESPAELARRVVRRLAHLEQRAGGVQFGLIAAGPSADEEVLAARSKLSAAFMRALAGATEGRLVLSVSDDTDDEARRHFAALRTVLGPSLGPAGLAKLRFEVARPVLRSGPTSVAPVAA